MVGGGEEDGVELCGWLRVGWVNVRCNAEIK